VADPLIPRRDLDFLLFDWLKVQDRLDIDPETVGTVLDLAERFATDRFLPHCRAADLTEPYLDEDGVHILPAIREALRAYADLGLFGLTFPEALGGTAMPVVVGTASLAIFSSASIATAAYPMLTAGNARLITTFGTPAQIDRFARPQIAGRWFGTMCLSEPQAGSGLADLRVTARRDGEDGLGSRYRLTGNKMWISGGDQDASENIVHLVLAKLRGGNGGVSLGMKAISLFIVPKILPDGTRNDVSVAGLNHKLGYRGTANCLLNFGEGEGAIGWLVGAEGDGLRQMFMMMNEARIAVGTGAAALAVRGYRQAARYAAERIQGRRIGQCGGDPVPIIEHADVRRMLLQQKVYAEGALALCLMCAMLVDQGDAESEALLGILTPVAKSWPSEFGLIANDLAIQVHGGYGYTRDFDVEQLWRDNRLNPIHEGTTGIQAIDLLGRKILRSDGSGMAATAAVITAIATNAHSSLAHLAEALRHGWRRIEQVVAALREIDGVEAFDDATLFLRAFGHVIVAGLWLDQASTSHALGDDSFSEGKRRACRFFFETELPHALTWLDIIEDHRGGSGSAPIAMFE
jgi:alkylation response protein AidB-like acyl-CoA dehydrogenase